MKLISLVWILILTKEKLMRQQHNNIYIIYFSPKLDFQENNKHGVSCLIYRDFWTIYSRKSNFWKRCWGLLYADSYNIDHSELINLNLEIIILIFFIIFPLFWNNKKIIKCFN